MTVAIKAAKTVLFKKSAKTFLRAVSLFVNGFLRAFQRIANCKNPFTINETASENVRIDFLCRQPWSSAEGGDAKLLINTRLLYGTYMCQTFGPATFKAKFLF